MPLPGALTLTTLSGTYTAPDGTPLGGQLTFTPSSALTNESGHPVLAATPLTVRLQAGTGAFSIALLNTDNAGLLPDTWMWHVIVQVPGAQETYYFGLPHTLGPTTDINALTPVSPPPAGVTFVASINGQTGDVVLADGFGILPPAGDLGAGTTLAPQVTATHLAAPLPIAQGGTGAGSGSAALAALGGATAASVTAETSRATTAEGLKAPLASPALTGSPTAPTQTTGDATTKIATDAFVGTAVAAEATRATTAEGLAAQKSANLSDLASAVTARGNIGAQGVRTPTAVKTGTSYTAVAGDYAKIDSSAGAYTVTLPTAPADKTVLGVKLVASAAVVNAVTVTCGGTDKFNLPGGGTTLSLKLLDQGCQLQYNSSAGVWDVHGDDLPLGGLDSRYANVFSPVAFGAKGDGTTDDTTAVQAAVTAAVAAGGIIDLGTSTFKTTAAIPIVTGFHLRGASQFGGGTITNNASDVFTMTGSVSHVVIENCNLTAGGSGTGGGHVFNATAGPSMSFWKILGVNATQTSTSHGIWYQVGGGWIDCLVDQQCQFTCSGSATLSPWSVLDAPGAWNSIKFTRMRCVANGATVPFFNIDPGFGAHTDTSVGMTASSTTVTDASAAAFDATAGFFVYSANFPGGKSAITAANPGVGYTVGTAATATLSGQTCLIGTEGWDEEIVFDHVTWEVCTGGAIWATGLLDVQINMCSHWDTFASADVYHFATAATGYPCRNITVRGGRAGQLTGGANNFFADSGCSNILIDSFGLWATPPVISSPAAQTTIINNTVTSSGILSTALPGTLAVSGNTGATAASRYAGATASGHPSSGTYAAGDFTVDQTGSIWICTTAGTPGTWTQVGSASGFAAANDPMQIGYNSTFSSAGLPTSNVAAGLASPSAYFIRLVAAGYTSSGVVLVVGVSSGNISIGYYTNNGLTGTTSKPGSRQQTTGGIACPAAGITTVTLGGSATPSLADWMAISIDGSVATFTSLTGVSNTNLVQGLEWTAIQARSDASCGTTSGSPTVTDAAAVSGDLNKGVTATRSDTLCTVTTGSGTVLDTHAVATDVGGIITNTTTPANFAANTTITAVTPGTSYTVSPVAVSGAGTATQTLVVSGPAFIPANTTITAVSAGTGYTISANANATASGLTFLVGTHPLPATAPTLVAESLTHVAMRSS